MKIIPILHTLILFGCSTASKVPTINPIAENYKDVIVLSILIQDHLRLTDQQEINLSELLEKDTLKGISNNFEKVEFKYLDGKIAYNYIFSMSRNMHVELTERENKLLTYKKILVEDIVGEYDGTIQFEYGERFYNLRRILIKSD